MVTIDSNSTEFQVKWRNKPVKTQMCFVDSELNHQWFTFDGDLSHLNGAIINVNKGGSDLFDYVYTEDGEFKKNARSEFDYSIVPCKVIFCGEAL